MLSHLRLPTAEPRLGAIDGRRHDVHETGSEGRPPRAGHRRVPTRAGATDPCGGASAYSLMAMTWIRDRALTLALMAMFLLFLAGQLVTGLAEYNTEQGQHGGAAVSVREYLRTGHPWEALFENWESEFLQMAVFVLLTTCLIQKGSPASRRPGVTELVDTDPRDFADHPDAPWPVRRGGWILYLYEHSLGLAFVLLFFDRMDGTRARWLCGIRSRSSHASPAAPDIHRLSDVGPILVRVVSELAERVSGNCLDGLACRVPATATVAGIETRPCAACRDGDRKSVV